MASWTEIANVALSYIGDQRLNDVETDQDETAKRVRDVRFALRDEVLRAHPWNFALELAEVAKDMAAPVWGFANQYTLPPDPFCLRVWKLDEKTHGRVRWKVRRRKIHTDASSPLRFIYIARVTDVAEFDPMFATTLASRIAHDLAAKVTDSTADRERLWKFYLETLSQARAIDGQEGTPDAPISGELEAARL